MKKQTVLDNIKRNYVYSCFKMTRMTLVMKGLGCVQSIQGSLLAVKKLTNVKHNLTSINRALPW